MTEKALSYHPHATPLPVLVTARCTEAGNSHSYPGSGDTHGPESLQAGSEASLGQE